MQGLVSGNVQLTVAIENNTVIRSSSVNLDRPVQCHPCSTLLLILIEARENACWCVVCYLSLARLAHGLLQASRIRNSGIF